MRVQADHWAVILDFCEKNPQIITNKFNSLGGRSENVELWKKLSIRLNSLGFGEKTVEGWKKTLTDWKSKTKAKAGAINTHLNKTGGGTSCNIILTTYEERLLMLMGKTSYQGNPQNIEIGFRKRKLFSECHKDLVTKPETAAVHSYLTDHTYTTDSTTEAATVDNDILMDYEVPIENETVTMTNNIIPLSSLHSNFPKVHMSSFSLPSTSNESYNFPCTLTPSYKILPTFTPPKPKDSCLRLTSDRSSNQLETPKVHLEIRQRLESTPLKPCTSKTQTPTDCDTGRRQTNKQRQNTRNKTENTTQAFQNMHHDLLCELRNINANIALVAENLKEMTHAIKK